MNPDKRTLLPTPEAKVRTRTRGLLVALLALAVPLACDPADVDMDAVVGDPEPGGTAVVGMHSDFQTFNPVTNTALTSMEVMNFMVFTPLVRYDENFEPEPYLAREWDLEDDHIVFRLYEGLRWHDGEPVTAEDVRFTFEMAKQEEAASLIGSAFLAMVESAEVIDDHTIRFDFVAPHSQPLDGFAWAPIPEHLLGDVSAAELAQAPYNRQPVGSGPFRFVSWEAGQQLTLEANEEFPDELGGRPYLDRLVFRIIPEPTTRVTELATGGIDVNYSVQAPEGREIEQQRGLQLHRYSGREFNYIGWNTAEEPFTDPQVRRALTMAIDREQIIEAILFGYADPAAGMIPPWSPLHPGTDPLPHDPDRARQMLADAGWEDRSGDGIVERDGRPFRFDMMVNSNNRLHQDIATVVQQHLRRVGVDMRIRAIEFQSMLRQHRDRDFQAVYSGWILDNFRVDPTPLFSCAEAETPQSANRSSYCDPEADRLIAAGLRETDPGRAEQIWGEFSDTLQEDQPFTFMYWLEDLAGVGQRIQGVDMDARSKLVGVASWWIPEDRRRGR